MYSFCCIFLLAILSLSHMNDFLLFVPVDNVLEVLVDSCHFLALKSAVLLLNSKTLNLSAAIKKIIPNLL